MKFPTVPTPWPCEGIRRASLNSFGFGGSNLHIVLDDAQSALATGRAIQIYQNDRHASTLNNTSTRASPQLLVWSAASEKSLQTLLQRYYERHGELSKAPDRQYLFDLAYTLGTGRSLLRWRTAAFLPQPSDLHHLETQVTKFTKSSLSCNMAFVFTGQGAQYAEMGMTLLGYSIFRKSIVEATAYLHELGCEWNLLCKS